MDGMVRMVQKMEEKLHPRTVVAQERPFSLEWELLDASHAANYHAHEDRDEEALAKVSLEERRKRAAHEDPIRLLWRLTP